MILIVDYSSSEDLSSLESWAHRSHSIYFGKWLSSPYSLGVKQQSGYLDGCRGKEARDGSESSGVNEGLDLRREGEASCRTKPSSDMSNPMDGTIIYLLGYERSILVGEGKCENKIIVWDISLRSVWNTRVEISKQINYLEDSYALTTIWDEGVKLGLSCHALSEFKLVSSNF